MASKSIVNKTQTVVFVLVVLGFVAVANYLLDKWFVRLDLTESKEYSISAPTKRMLKGLDDIINIKVYFSENLPPQMQPLEAGVRDMLIEFRAYAGKNLRISWEDTQSDEAKRKVRALGIPEVQLQSFEKDKAQAVNCFMGIAVLYEDKKEVLPLVQNLENLEYDLAQAVMKVHRDEMPKVGVLKTDTLPYLPPNIQRQMNITDKTEEKYKPIFQQLEQNYEVVTVDISDGSPVDSTIRTLIVPGGDDKSFTTRDLFEIDQYFMKGGNLIVLADAVRVSCQYGPTGSPQSPRILDLLEHYGVAVEKSMVLDASCGQVQIPQKVGIFQMNVATNYPYFVRIGQGGFNEENPAVSGLGEVIMPWVSPLKILVDKEDSTGAVDTSAAVTAQVMALSSPNSWIQTGNFNLNPRQEWGQIVKQKEEEFQRSTLMAYLNGSFASYFAGKEVPPVKEEADSSDTLGQIELKPEDTDREIVDGNTAAHLVVAGDSDFLSSQNAAPGNIAWLLNVVDWLTLDENLIAIRSRTLVDRTIDSDRLGEGASGKNMIRLVNILAMPVLVIAIGLFIFFKRREKTGGAPAPRRQPATPAGTAPKNEQSEEEKRA
jgi:gliding-associated putative ABC transporter substrate-binding component GldG